MLGQDTVKAITETGVSITQLDIDDLDITNKKAVKTAVSRIRPHVIINCAAFTNVDECEFNRDTAMMVNGDGAGNVAAAAEENHATIIHISTDYVFDGTKNGPYAEDDPPKPVNVYGESKLEGEKQVARNCSRHIILRTAWLYGAGGKNFVDTIAGLAKDREELSVVNDQHGSPTYTPHLAAAIKTIVLSVLDRNPATGIYNVTATGFCSWYEFALEILKYRPGIVKSVKPVSTLEFPRPAARPHNSVLDNGKLNDTFEVSLPHWKDALREYLQ